MPIEHTARRPGGRAMLPLGRRLGQRLWPHPTAQPAGPAADKSRALRTTQMAKSVALVSQCRYISLGAVYRTALLGSLSARIDLLGTWSGTDSEVVLRRQMKLAARPCDNAPAGHEIPRGNQKPTENRHSWKGSYSTRMPVNCFCRRGWRGSLTSSTRLMAKPSIRTANVMLSLLIWVKATRHGGSL